MTKTVWDSFLTMGENCKPYSPCGSCSLCGIAEYNRKHFTPGPLDRPGTEAYFASIMNSLRREAESRSRSKLIVEKRSPLPKVERLQIGHVFAGQLCSECNRKILSGEECFAFDMRPAVACSDCGPKVKNFAIEEPETWGGLCTHSKKDHERRECSHKVLVRVVAE
jgi:hypothetical protein